MKTKRIGWIGIMLAAGILPAAEKIGIINPPAVLQSSIKGKEVLARLKASAESNQKKFASLQREIDSLEKELLSLTISADSREKKSLELQNKRTNQKRFAEDAQKDLELKKEKEFAALQAEIMPIIEQIAKSEGFTVVLDITTAGVAYFQPMSDITAKVIQTFDAKYSKGEKKP